VGWLSFAKQSLGIRDGECFIRLSGMFTQCAYAMWPSQHGSGNSVEQFPRSVFF